MKKLLLAASVVLVASPASAQVCAPRDEFIKQMAERYKETRTSGGLQSETEVLEVYTSPDGETWTIIVTNTRGVSCMVASGQNWTQFEASILGDDS